MGNDTWRVDKHRYSREFENNQQFMGSKSISSRMPVMPDMTAPAAPTATAGGVRQAAVVCSFLTKCLEAFTTTITNYELRGPITDDFDRQRRGVNKLQP
eukprot:CAMPEP_0197579306 /NCGR_PEP_ID=MMETSP1326-20131121/3336_1 /TAXON_ID=1155430 /ORGANISM="Genus nov. species nov., Strain RCC2288" /LENGTH=98 /DNA_ID=CAMNT_0043142731 /DNA_START=134 /DNA_END=430 /DNA_ORIENTATION=-